MYKLSLALIPLLLTAQVSNIIPHTTQHKDGGYDEVASATPGANVIVKAEADGDINAGWLSLDSTYAWINSHSLSKATDGDSVLLTIENSQAHAAASTNETAQIRFGFGGNLDVARIVVGKDDDYDPGSGEDDSFMAFFVDRNGTATEVVRIESTRDVGINMNAPEARLHIIGDSTAFPTPESGSTLVLEDSGANIIQMIGNAGSKRGINFGSTTDTNAGSIFYNASAGINAFLFSINGGAAALEIRTDGGIQLFEQDLQTTCNAMRRGTIYYKRGATSVADAFEVCLKNASDVYAWEVSATPTP